jgi:hypothetical protein
MKTLALVLLTAGLLGGCSLLSDDRFPCDSRKVFNLVVASRRGASPHIFFDGQTPLLGGNPRPGEYRFRFEDQAKELLEGLLIPEWILEPESNSRSFFGRGICPSSFCRAVNGPQSCYVDVTIQSDRRSVDVGCTSERQIVESTPGFAERP